jgi:adenylate cyclase, class 2
MLEVEVKAILKSKEVTLTALEKLGISFEEPSVQIDHVFVQNAESIAAFYQNTIFIRIREQKNKKPILTLKKKQANLASLEYETEIESVRELAQILTTLGYPEALIIKKTRAKQKYNEYTICIDEVEGLGTFIEVEKLVRDGDITTIQDELFAFVLTLGIQPEDRILDAYDTLLLKNKLK